MANICAVLRGQKSTNSSRPLFRLIISHIMESEIKKGLFRLLQIYLKYLGAYKMTQAVKKVSEIFG